MNIRKRAIALGMTLGMLVANMPVSAYADDVMVEDDFYIVPEDDTEAAMEPEADEADVDVHDDSIIVEEDGSESELISGFASEETEEELQAAEDSFIGSGKCGDNLRWTEYDHTLTISGTGDMYDWKNKNEGPDDRSPWHRDYTIYNVVIEEGVTSVGEYAFLECSGITNVILPSSLTKIKEGSFIGCTKMTTIFIPESVSFLYGGAFSGCPSLESINVHPENAYYLSVDGVVFNKDRTVLINYPPAKAINLDILENVTEITDYAFSDHEELTEVTIPDGVTKLGRYALAGCRNLSTINLPDSLSYIGPYAFAGLSKLTSITLPGSLERIDEGAFRYSGLESIVIPPKITSIEPCMFEWCSKLVSVTLPEGITNIDNSAFCFTGITNVILPNSVESIRDDAFYSTDLESIIIPESVESIGESAFGRCDKLESITIPKSVKSIGEDAFDDCDNLTISCYAGSYAEQYAQEHEIPYELIDEGGHSIVDPESHKCGNDLTWEVTTDSSTGQKTLTISGDGEMWDAEEGEVFWEDSEDLLLASSLNSVVFESTINHKEDGTIYLQGPSSIGDNAFNGNSQSYFFTQVYLGSSLRTIGENAFLNCSMLNTVHNMDGTFMESIGDNAFRGCSSLGGSIDGSLIFPHGLKNIGASAFQGCSSLEAVKFSEGLIDIGTGAFQGCSSLKAVTFFEGLKDIGTSAFQGCSSLEAVTFPKTIETIGENAFADCSENLTIYGYPGVAKNYAEANGINFVLLAREASEEELELLKKFSFSFINTPEDLGYPDNYKIPLERYDEFFTPLSAKMYYSINEYYGGWGGSCGGFTLSSLLLNNNTEGLSIKEFNNTADELLDLVVSDKNASNMTVRDLLEMMQIAQSTYYMVREYRYDDLDGLMQLLDNGEPCYLGIDSNSAEVYHAVVALKAERISDDRIDIYVYDPNDRYSQIKEEGLIDVVKLIKTNPYNNTFDKIVYSSQWLECTLDSIGYIPLSRCKKVWENKAEIRNAQTEVDTLIIEASKETGKPIKTGEILQNGRIVVDIKDGSGVTTDDIYIVYDMDSTGFTTRNNNLKLYMPVNEYTYNNKNCEDVTFHVIHNDQAISVSTNAQSAAFIVDDNQKKNMIKLNLQKGDYYSVTTYSDLENATGKETVQVTGKADSQKELEIGFNDNHFLAPTHDDALSIDINGQKVDPKTLKPLNGASINNNTADKKGASKKPTEKVTISKKPSIKKPAAAKGKITVKWKHFKHTSKKTKKIWKKIKKVQVQCATDKTFKNKVKDVKIGRGKTKYAIKGLKKKTTYYVRVRYYDGVGYSAWSKVKKVKTK